MADDDDDEAFGDFTFAASSPSLFSHPPQINVSHDATSNSKKDAEDEEDEWGDFVTPKSESDLDRSILSEQKSGGFVGLVSDRIVLDRIKEEGEKGVRVRGALPLSIFGEDEGEEVVKEGEERELGGGFGFGGGEVFRGKSGELGKKGSDLSDLLASLYDQGGGGGGGSGNGNTADPIANGLKKEFDPLDLNSNGYVNGISSRGGSNGKRMGLSDYLFDLDVMNSASDGFSSSARAFDQGQVIKVDNGKRTKSDEYVFNFLSSGVDGFNFSGMQFDAAVPVKTENGWGERKLELDFDFNIHEPGNDVENIGSTIEINGSKPGTKSSSSEDNDEDGWEFQGNTDVSKEQDDGRQCEMTGANILNNGPTLNSYPSVSGSNELQVNSSEEDETQRKWEFMDFAAPSSKDDSSKIRNFNGNGIPTAKENDDGVWDFQGFALPTANAERNSDLAFVDNCNTSVEEEDYDGWEFQVASVDRNPKQGWNTGVQGVGAQGATSRSDTQVAGSHRQSSQKTNFVQKVDSGNDNPMGVSASPGHDFGFDSLVSSTMLQNEAFNDSVSEGKRLETENQSTSATFNGSVDADDSYWDFKDSFPETSQEKKVKKADADGGQKGALPPSLFSDEPLDSSDSDALNHDNFNFNPSQSLSNGFRNPDPRASLSDLILNLYNQSEKNYSIEYPEQDVILDVIQAVNDPLSNDEDDFDGTWDFKDASVSSSIAYDQSPYQPHESSYRIPKMENLVDFYCKLKDQSSLAAICHLACLKEAKSNAEDAEVEAFDEKIQDALVELKKANIVLVDAPENCKPDNCLKEFHQILSEPKFQLLESEYGLSRRLTLAEKDLKPAIELVEHATSILKILSTGSAEQQFIYISTWVEILFVCAQELQHGASIWQHAVEKSIHSQILSQTKGKTFVRALGEIYRVVLILEASSKAYRPWILLNSTDGDGFFALLNECSTLWSNSGLNEALEDLSNPANSESAGEVQALLESIIHIRELDVHTVSLRRQDSVCCLSLLNGTMIPDVKMVFWKGEQFFLPLANLWANLISSDPPNLPQIVAG